MKQKIIILSIILLVLTPIASASCLTDTEIQEIRDIANNASTSPELFVNLFERLCNSDFTNQAINSFNSSVNGRIDSLNSSVDTRINLLNTQVQNTLNNSALVNTLTQIGVLYNQSINLNNQSLFVSNTLTDFESKLNARMDNQTIDTLNQMSVFKNDINNIVVTKQTNALSTNRIFLIAFGVIALAGGIWFYSRKKIAPRKNINQVPWEQDWDNTPTRPMQQPNEKPFDPYKDKGISARKTK